MAGSDVPAGGVDLFHRRWIGEQLKSVFESFEVLGADEHRRGSPLRVSTTRSCWCSTRSTISDRWALMVASGKVSGMTRIIVIGADGTT